MRKRTLVTAALVILIIFFVFNPPRFWLNLIKRVETTPESGAALVRKYDCRGCHSIGGKGASKAPGPGGHYPQPKGPCFGHAQDMAQESKGY